MGKFSELNLYWWEREELEDLDKEFHISEKTAKELDKLVTKLHWNAQELVEEANRLESKADTIRRYLNLIKK